MTNYVDIVETGLNVVDTADADADSSSLVSNNVLKIGVPSNTPWGPATKQLPIQVMARTTCYKTGRIFNTNATFLVGAVEFTGDYLANYHRGEEIRARYGSRKDRVRTRSPIYSRLLMAPIVAWLDRSLQAAAIVAALRRPSSE